MATRDTEGRREIEAAKQRLSAAKSHVTFLSKTLATAQASEDAAKKAWKKAKKNREDIQAQAADSKKELAEAKKFLAEAEQRWEVISIDDDDDDDDTPQMSPREKGNDNNNDDDDDEVITLSDSPPRDLGRSSVWDSIFREAATKHITVQGCGTSTVNGIYTKTGTLCEGSPTYSKQGLYNGDSEVIVIFCRKMLSGNKFWYIGISGKPVLFYKSSRAVGAGPNAGSAVCPPSLANEWVKEDAYKGLLPLPRVKLGMRGFGGI